MPPHDPPPPRHAASSGQAVPVVEPARPRLYAYGLALAATAGAVDAVGFLHFGTYFVSFMSGNTTRFAVAMAQGQWPLALQGAAILVCFVAGVVIGELATGVPPRRGRMTLLVEAALLLAAAALAGTLWTSLLLALASGMHNALALRAERIGLALTYVTGTLVHLGRAIAAWAAGRGGMGGWAYAGLWLALTLGAIAGGLAHRLGEGAALTLLAGVLVVLAMLTRGQGNVQETRR